MLSTLDLQVGEADSNLARVHFHSSCAYSEPLTTLSIFSQNDFGQWFKKQKFDQ